MGFFAITTTKETRMTDPVLEDLAVVRRLIDRILKRRPERHRMTTNPAADRALRTVLENHNLPVGSSLENRVTWRLHRWHALDQCQYRVGPYRLDYAWPNKLIALEADGPYHLWPDAAIKDAARDRYLRSVGWLVFRIDDTGDEVALEEQLCRVVRMVSSEDDGWAAQERAQRRWEAKAAERRDGGAA